MNYLEIQVKPMNDSLSQLTALLTFKLSTMGNTKSVSS